MFSKYVLTMIVFATIGLTTSPFSPRGALKAADVFLRGDANSDGAVSISDAMAIQRWLFNGQRPPSCENAADVDDNGIINLTDSVRLLQHFIPGGDWGDIIAAPFPEPGVDTTPSEQLDCLSYDAQPPEETDDLVRLGDVTAAPGEEVEIPVFVTSSVDLDAVQIIVDYDPEVFTPAPQLNYDGTFFGVAPNEDGGRGFSALKTWPELGGFSVTIVGDLLLEGREIPAGADRLIVKIPGTVSADVEPGSVLSLTARTEGFGPYGLHTELTHGGEARFVTTLPQVEGALLQIVGDLTFFRGDANGDETVNLSDAQFTLNYLFVSGSEVPSCFDAADTNDDGRVNITDPIAVLMWLFDSADPLPPPHPGKGIDPTVDDLSCGGLSG